MRIEPKPETIEGFTPALELLSAAKDLVREAQECREAVRRYKKGNSVREAQVGLTITRIQALMTEVKRETSRLATLRPPAYEDYAADMFRTSEALQRERRKLRKLLWEPVEGLDWQAPPPLVVIEAEELQKLIDYARKAGYRVPKAISLAAA